MHTHAKTLLPGTALLLVTLAIISLATGDIHLTPSQLWDGLLHNNTGNDATLAINILWGMRIPRLIVTLLSGAALASSGLIMQAFFRNSLASPGLIGVSAGATTGAVCIIALGLTTQSLFLLPAAAIAGAFASTLLVMTLARHGTSTERLLLSGVALNAMLGAVTSYILSDSILSHERNAQIIFWLLGGLENRTWEHVVVATPILLAAILLCPLGRPMDLLSLGTAEAQSLGVDVKRLQRHLLILSTILTALATAVVGTVGFVGLIVPHILRLLAGAEHRLLIPLSLLAGATFMLACDIASHFASNLRIGIVTAIIGGPFFLWLLQKK
ncbi:MAG: iron ABC transporter permease [Puniceicoccales bacterium]|jgi:iron complex transport system permease protein|nr:iron ABC transporter permease [Puniceicoccales bacterium]